MKRNPPIDTWLDKKNAARSQRKSATRTDWKSLKRQKPQQSRASVDSANRERLSTEQQDLAARYLPLARSLAKPLKKAWPSVSDELESAACLALVEAAQAFDSSRNVRFSTFVRYRIWGALRDVQRQLPIDPNEDVEGEFPLFVPFSSNIEENDLLVRSQNDRSVEEDYESSETFENWLGRLPSLHAAACREIYINDRNHSEAAKAVGCSKSRLSYLHKQSIAMLNDVLRMQELGRNRRFDDEDDDERSDLDDDL